MAVVEQHPYIDEKRKKHNDLVKHYSDDGKTIIQLETGIEYEEAIDTYPCKYTYVEKVEPEEEGAEVEDEGSGIEADNS